MRRCALMLAAATASADATRIKGQAHFQRQKDLELGAETGHERPEDFNLLQLQRELPDMLRSGGESLGQEYTMWGVKLTYTTNAAEEEQQQLLLRTFLRAEDGNPTEARRKLEKMIRWRRTILSERPPDGFGIFPTNLLLRPGLSERPTLVLDVGKLPVEAFSDSAQLVQWWVAMHDAMYAQVFASGSPCFDFVVDCSGLRGYHFGTAARICAAQLAPVLNDHYPDQLAGETLVINSPAWFRAAYVVLRPFLPRSLVKNLRLTRMNVGPCIDLVPTSSGSARGTEGAVKTLDLLRQRWVEQGQNLAREWGDGLDGARQKLASRVVDGPKPAAS